MSWITWPVRLLSFYLWYTKEVFTTSITVLRDNLTPGQDSTPGFARYPTDCRTDLELTVLASLITLTPGTLTLGTAHPATAGGPRELYVHSMYNTSAEDLREDLADMETRLLHALRRKGDRT